jgi:hypothetical protein
MTCIAYGNGLVVMCGDRGITWVSSDLGESWTQTTGDPPFNYPYDSNLSDYIEDVHFADGWFVQATDTGILRASQDGVNWVEVLNANTGSSHSFTRIAYGNGIWIAIGKFNFYYCVGLPTGAWMAVTNHNLDLSYVNGEYQIAGVVTFGSGKFVAGGYSGTMAYSTDGISWTAIASPFGNSKSDDKINAIGYDKQLGWIACNLFAPGEYNSGLFSTSKNGIDWSPAFLPTAISRNPSSEWVARSDFRYITRLFALPKIK